jgi:hypothetical protein
MHHRFDAWVRENEDRFARMLNDGERACGEWLAQAHGTRYDLEGRSPWVMFDIMRGHDRVSVEELAHRSGEFATPKILSNLPISIEDAMKCLGDYGWYGAMERVEGVVWRVERDGKVDFLVKYVRPDKVDGCYLNLPEGPIWNWIAPTPFVR